MIVDCMTCPVRGQRCDDCAVTVLLSSTVTAGLRVLSETDLQLDAAERRAVSMLVGAGLVKRAAASKLRARQESVNRWDPVRDVG